jgi:excisionase family DNA binding protein
LENLFFSVPKKCGPVPCIFVAGRNGIPPRDSERTQMPPLLLSIQATMQATGLPRSTVYRLLAEGALGARKAGRRTLVDAETVRAYVAGLPAATFRTSSAKAA